jgi:hypothetical protein
VNLSAQGMDQRRAELSARIALQRGELFVAYGNLGKPLQYTEYAMRGFGFLRQNPWVISAVPAAFSIGSILLGFIKKKPTRPPRGRQQELERLERLDRRPRSLGGHLVKWGGHGWRLFRFYRRLRAFLP